MRRMDRAVTDPNEITKIMEKCQVLRLAINTDGAPYILPVNFGMEEDGMTLYIHGAREGTKYGWMEKDNRVGFEMDLCHGLVMDEKDHSCSVDYESVVGWGVVTELTAEQEKMHALRMLMKHYRQEDFPVNMGPMLRTRFLRIEVRERTAKHSRRF